MSDCAPAAQAHAAARTTTGTLTSTFALSALERERAPVCVASSSGIEANEVYPRLVERPGKDWRNFPGAHLVRVGLADLARGVETSESLLVATFASRLRRAGLEIPTHTVAEPERRLYLLLAAREPDAAYGRYNALRRRLVSFAHALECAS